MAEQVVSLVTGASRGIGKAIALGLGRAGSSVIVNYSSSQSAAEEVVEEIKRMGQEAVAIQADVSNRDDVQRMMAAIKEKFGKLNIVVNNAGIVKDRTLKKMTQEEWDIVIATNLTSVYMVTRASLELLQDKGRIVNISSIIGQYGNFGQTNYAAAKAGILGFTKSLAKELGKKKITVNAVCPGFVKTEITKDIPFIRKKVIKFMTPLGEEAEPEDIANAVVFLASDKARYITGSVINVDGGLSF